MPLRPRAPLVAFLSTRAILFVAVYASILMSPLRTGAWRAFPDLLPLDCWIRWDSESYGRIATLGWHWAPGLPLVNFFPLYPALGSLAGLPFRLFLDEERAFYVGGFLVSQVAFWLALEGIYRLTAAAADERAARRTVWLLACFPFALFASAVYAEALYLAFVVWSFHAARRENWAAASLLMCAAGATRIVGFIAIGALGVEHLRLRGWRLGNLRRDAWWLLIAPLGFLGLLGYCGAAYGQPLLPFTTHMTDFDREVGVRLFGWAIYNIRHPPDVTRAPLMLTYLALVPLGLALAVDSWRRFGAGLGVYALSSVVLAALTGLDAMGRLTLVIFPLFMSAGVLLRRDRGPVFAVVCVGAFGLELIFGAAFTHWMGVI